MSRGFARERSASHYFGRSNPARVHGLQNVSLRAHLGSEHTDRARVPQNIPHKPLLPVGGGPLRVRILETAKECC